MATKRIYLGSDWVIRRRNITSDPAGLDVDGAAVRAFFSETPDGEAIDVSLDLIGTVNVDEIAIIVQGSDLYEQVLALWEAAQDAGTKLTIYERVVIEDMDYSDVRPLQVERDRPPHDAEE